MSFKDDKQQNIRKQPDFSDGLTGEAREDGGKETECNASRSFMPSRSDFLKFTGVDAFLIVRKRRTSIQCVSHSSSWSPDHSRGSLELKPSDIQTRFPPGVFAGAPY